MPSGIYNFIIIKYAMAMETKLIPYIIYPLSIIDKIIDVILMNHIAAMKKFPSQLVIMFVKIDIDVFENEKYC